MQIFLDTADVKEVRELSSLGLVDGVTTNPSLIAKEGRPFRAIVDEILPEPGAFRGRGPGGGSRVHVAGGGPPPVDQASAYGHRSGAIPGGLEEGAQGLLRV